MIKRMIAHAPQWIQEDLKLIHYRRQIRKGQFIISEPEFHDLDSFVNKGDWVVDIGANVGHYTRKLSNIVGATGRVIAFEPVPSTFVLLAYNMRSCTHKNITLINAAVSNSSTQVGMVIPTSPSGIKNYYRASIASKSSDENTSVLTFSLNSFHIENRISLIKIDAEGHEPNVFLGIIEIIKRDKPTLIIETVTETMHEQLLQLGYIEEKYQGSPNTVYKNRK